MRLCGEWGVLTCADRVALCDDARSGPSIAMGVLASRKGLPQIEQNLSMDVIIDWS